MSIWELIRKIDPEKNENVVDPIYKLKLIVMNIDNEEVLNDYSKEWDKPQDNNFYKLHISSGKTVQINDKTGIIVDVIEKKDMIEVIVYLDKKFKIFHRKNSMDQSEFFYVIGYPTDNEYFNADFIYQKHKMIDKIK